MKSKKPDSNDELDADLEYAGLIELSKILCISRLSTIGIPIDEIIKLNNGISHISSGLWSLLELPFTEQNPNLDKLISSLEYKFKSFIELSKSLKNVNKTASKDKMI